MVFGICLSHIRLEIPKAVACTPRCGVGRQTRRICLSPNLGAGTEFITIKTGGAGSLPRTEATEAIHLTSVLTASESCPARNRNPPAKMTLAPHQTRPAGYSIEDHWITLDGARMRYLRSGSGPALLLLHGLLGYSFSWRYALPALAGQATVHAVDMLGVGFSDRPPGLDVSLRANAERLLRFLDAVNVDSCDVLGTSHGGAVAMMTAALAPDRIRRLVLVAPVNPWSIRGRRTAAVLSNPAVAPIFLRIAPLLKPFHGYFLHRLYGDRSRIRPGTLGGYSAPFALPGAFEHGIGILRTWDRDLEELQAALPRIAHIPRASLVGRSGRRRVALLRPSSGGAIPQEPCRDIRGRRPSSL